MFVKSFTSYLIESLTYSVLVKKQCCLFSFETYEKLCNLKPAWFTGINVAVHYSYDTFVLLITF